jgi:hypothetical protein
LSLKSKDALYQWMNFTPVAPPVVVPPVVVPPVVPPVVIPPTPEPTTLEARITAIENWIKKPL